ncbi:alkaline phosphatase family protein [Streptomyces sp. NBC_00513]|uniref:alkaline phosphatase family protein n=1 Tax=unclassified Streptomyces TaxID=2593676 RepID=UPI00224ED418|nr:alkaline phosphatase family protein [Streptomyces sp. NBC_00424]MCX5070990.1 alkaline phosphatase family protein [Streptomyces sp. NBC_00424]WUD45575.1 alkaline phosphatase family protein [Streptomyces sp. NBC_00513]
MNLKPLARLAIALAIAVTATTLPLAGAVQAAPSSRTAVTAPYKNLPGGTKRSKSLVIGVDGAAFDVLAKTDLPRLKSLMAGGMTATSNLYANPYAPTVSGPGWSTIATGVWPDKHNVKDNNFTDPAFGTYPDYATRLETADPAISTLVVGTWSPIPTIIFGEKTDLRLEGGDDAGTTAKAVDYLRNGNPDSTFVHLDEVDGAGHNSGSASPQYAEALRKADNQIGQLLDAVATRPSYADEDWLITVTADHGHTPTGGHGGNTPLERKTFVIAKGPGIPPGSVRNDVKITDIAPTVLKHEGVITNPAWKLDGTSIRDLVADDFDSLRGSLKTQVDETRPGPDVKGWTTTAPQGWSIDNSRMPAGGITEWRGWSFATDEFWTNSELGQNREGNVRARDVFAVADSDEWDDKAHDAGQFDSTLVSPVYELAGTGAVNLSFASHYRVDGPQTGDVYAVWDGGAPALLKSYRTNVNTNEILKLTAPAGARSLQLRFRYTGTNSAFWTVDRVTVHQSAPSQPAVASLTAHAESLDKPDITTPWRITAKTRITTPNGQAVRDATVTAELRFDGHTTTLKGTTNKGAVAKLVGYALYANSAELAITKVEKGAQPYFGELDRINTLTVNRPTHR